MRLFFFQFLQKANIIVYRKAKGFHVPLPIMCIAELYHKTENKAMRIIINNVRGQRVLSSLVQFSVAFIGCQNERNKTGILLAKLPFFRGIRALVKKNPSGKSSFGRIKVEMFYGEKFESVNAFIDELKNYIHYYNNERISLKLKGMSPVQYRTHSQTILYLILSKLCGSRHSSVFFLFGRSVLGTVRVL